MVNANHTLATPSGQFCLGLKPVQPGTLPLKLRNYLTPSLLPDVESLPATFGHAGLISDWGMFLNDRIGDCAPVGAIHQTMLNLAEAGKTANWDQSLTATNSAAVNYGAVTGYQPGPEIENPQAPQNPTDQGTDVGELLKFWQQTGIVDADGNHHKIVGWAGLTPGDWDEFLIALRLFQTVSIGIEVPDYAEEQFAAGQAWHVKRSLFGPHIIGGHCIPGVARELAGNVDSAGIITWDKEIPMEADFYRTFSNVAAVAFSEEMLTNLRTIDGVDDVALRADLPLLNTSRVA